MTALNRSVERACGLFGSQSAIARLLKISPPTVNQWVKGMRPVPPVHCVSIERATNGQITRQELRPDDWQDIWPELANRGEQGRTVDIRTTQSSEVV